MMWGIKRFYLKVISDKAVDTLLYVKRHPDKNNVLTNGSVPL